RPQHRHHVAGIAERGQPQYANTARRRSKGHKQDFPSYGALRALFLRGRCDSVEPRAQPVTNTIWPLGSEVKRKPLTGGAMLYDAPRASNFAPAWFDPEYWRGRGEIEGEARGRGTTYFIRSGDKHFVLRHYRRGGLVARVSSDRYFWQSESATRPFA